ncbi:MAG: cytochrome c [Betaproteobacteria bacterium]|nr:cytochrome c [Betaproteobacteria bacterium]
MGRFAREHQGREEPHPSGNLDAEGEIRRNRRPDAGGNTKLGEAARARNEAGVKAQFGAVGKTCGACHDSFRAK